MNAGGNNRKNSRIILPQQALQAMQQASRLVLAYSGGCDSQVLLHLLRQHTEYKQLTSNKLIAVHVNHQLAEQANQWQQHCENYCQQQKIPIVTETVDATAPRGQSPEAHARKLRYQALAKHLPQDAILLTAHHANDQAETLLLQALRGAGVEGMAAMPLIRTFAKGKLLRPLLQTSQGQIKHYANIMQLNWVEDGSNQDHNIDRNYIRHKVMPAITANWPKAAQTLGNSCQHLAAARMLLQQQAEADIKNIADSNSIDIGRLQAMGNDRANNVFRHWLRCNNIQAPPTKKIYEILRQCINAKPDSTPQFNIATDTMLRRYQNRLYLLRPQLLATLRQCQAKDMAWKMDINSTLELPHGKLQATATAPGTGLDKNSEYTVKFRSGGEVLAKGGTLKQFLQQQRVLPWWRDHIPLICDNNNKIICIPTLWCSNKYQPKKDQKGINIHWQDAPQLVAAMHHG